MTEKQERAWDNIKKSKEPFIDATSAAEAVGCEAQGLREFIREQGLINYISSGSHIYICRKPFIDYVYGISSSNGGQK